MARDLILMALAMFTWGLGESTFISFQPLYLQSLGADPLSIGGILGAFGLMMTITHIPAGYLADRVGRKPLLVAAWVVGILAAAIMALARSLPVFVTGMLIYALTFFVMSPLNSYITAARGRYSVARVLTLISASYSTGGIIGPWIGGWIGDRYGLQRNYQLAIIVFVLSTLFLLLLRPQPVEAQPVKKEGSRWQFDRTYSIYLGVIFLSALAMWLPQPLTSNFLQNERHLDLRQIGQLYSMGYIGIVVLNLSLGQLPARAGFLISQTIVSLYCLSLWRGSSMLWYSLGFFLSGGVRTARAMATAQIRELVHESVMGLAYGLSETISASAVILAPVLAGYLYTRNPVWIYSFSIVLIGVSLLVSLAFFSSGREKTDQSVAPESDPLDL